MKLMLIFCNKLCQDLRRRSFDVIVINIYLVTLVFNLLHLQNFMSDLHMTFFLYTSLMTEQINLNNNILINNQIVSRVESTKFLGVIIDSALTWKDHINYIKTKIAKGIGIICKGRKHFNTSTLLTLYYSFIYPYLTYCVEVWGNTSNCYLNSLSKLQKRAIRIITSANYRAHTDPLFNKLKILPLSKISDYSIIILMYKYARGMLPSVFNDMFIRNYEIHSYNTRQSTKIHVPKVKTAAYHNSFKYKGTLLWNFISDKINCNCSLAAYKHQLKLYLLKNNIIVK